jgi:hypothetical protein
MRETCGNKFRKRTKAYPLGKQAFTPEFHIAAYDGLDVVLVNAAAGRT